MKCLQEPKALITVFDWGPSGTLKTPSYTEGETLKPKSEGF